MPLNEIMGSLVDNLAGNTITLAKPDNDFDRSASVLVDWLFGLFYRPVAHSHLGG